MRFDEAVEAPGFQLVDSQGRRRANLALTDSGQPYLSLLDAQQRTRVVVRLDDSGYPEIVFWDQNARQTLILANSAYGSLIGIGADGVPRILLSVGEQRDAFIRLDDPHGAARLEVAVDRYGRPTAAWRRRPGERYWVSHFEPPRR
jgi:hypothetical protein